MQTNKILGSVLIIAALFLGYLGLNKVTQSTKEVKVLGLEINASDESQKTEGYFYLGFAVLLFAGGIKIITKKGAE